MKENILITGGAGFIGLETSNFLLNKGYNLTVLDKLCPQIHSDGQLISKLDKNVNLIIGDINNKELLLKLVKKNDYIFHFAAETGVGQSMYELKKYCNTNVNGTANLWEAIKKNGKNVKKVILSSSRAVYGEGAYMNKYTNKNVPFKNRRREDLENRIWKPYLLNSSPDDYLPIPTSEDFELNPNSIYGFTKKYQEDISIFMSSVLNIPYTILRYFNVYGSNQAINNPYTGVLATFYRNLHYNKRIDLYEEGEPIRDFIHVKDVTKVNYESLSNNFDNKIINVGTGRGLKIIEIAEILTSILGCENKINITTKYRLGDVFSCFSDSSRLQNLKKIDFIKLEDGLKELISGWNNLNIFDISEKAEIELLKHKLLNKC